MKTTLRAVSGSRASGARARENIEIIVNVVIDIIIGIEMIVSIVGFVMIVFVIIFVVIVIIIWSVVNIDWMMDITDNRRRTRLCWIKVLVVVMVVMMCGMGEIKCYCCINMNSSDYWWVMVVVAVMVNRAAVSFFVRAFAFRSRATVIKMSYWFSLSVICMVGDVWYI